MTNVEAQRLLIKMGYDLGAGGPSGKGDDGKIGPKSQKAIKAYQVFKGLPPTGKLDPATVAALSPKIEVPRDTTLPTFQPSPTPVGPKPVWPLQKDCMSFYGGVGLNQKPLALPFPMRIAWDKKVVVRRISVHEKVHASAARAFEKIYKAYPTEEDRKKIGIDLFGGALNVRKMRGGSSYSMHSWGIAIDFDPERNQLNWKKDKARLAQADAVPFWEAWESEGWVSLGRARNFDWMHVQAARL